MMRLLRSEPLYAKFLFGQALSEIGDRLHSIAVVVYVYGATGSAVALSQVILATSLGSLLFAPVAGVLGDSLSRRAVLVLADFLRATVVLGFVIVRDPLWFPVFAFILACLDVLYWTVWNASLPNLVRPGNLLAANSLAATLERVIQLLAPAGAGAIIAWSGAHVVFLINAASFALSGLVPVFNAIPSPPRDAEAVGSGPRAGFWRQALDSLRLVRGTPAYLFLFLVAAGGSVAIGLNNASVLPLLERVLGRGAAAFGYLTSALAAGLLIGSATAPGLGARLGAPRLLPASVLLAGLALPAFALCPSLPPMLAARFLLGLGVGVHGVVFATLLQSSVADSSRSRVYAIVQLGTDLSGMLGVALAGFLIEGVGPGLPFAVAGVLLVGAVLPLAAKLAAAAPATRAAG